MSRVFQLSMLENPSIDTSFPKFFHNCGVCSTFFPADRLLSSEGRHLKSCNSFLVCFFRRPSFYSIRFNGPDHRVVFPTFHQAFLNLQGRADRVTDPCIWLCVLMVACIVQKVLLLFSELQSLSSIICKPRMKQNLKISLIK